MHEHNNHAMSTSQATSLPGCARVPVNRCNLPPALLGSLTFQRHPVALHIDGVQELHRRLFAALDGIDTAARRAAYFMDYMTVQFRFEHPEDTGLETDAGRVTDRRKADYRRILRGWLFDPNGQEAAVLKSWVESRFGLLTRYHAGPLHDAGDCRHASRHYQAFLESRARGLYATNALEAQFDLVYSYCQYELAQRYRPDEHIRLYRGINRPDDFEVLEQTDRHHAVLLLNNLNSFTRNRERADEFGDYILEVDACWQKILFYCNLLPGLFSGEEEVLLIGGVFEVSISL